jgi:hypothetical protein
MCQAMNSVFAHFIFCQYLGTILKVVRTKKPEVDRHEYGNYEEQGHFYDMNEDHLKQVLDAGARFRSPTRRPWPRVHCSSPPELRGAS